MAILIILDWADFWSRDGPLLRQGRQHAAGGGEVVGLGWPGCHVVVWLSPRVSGEGCTPPVGAGGVATPHAGPLGWWWWHIHGWKPVHAQCLLCSGQVVGGEGLVCGDDSLEGEAPGVGQVSSGAHPHAAQVGGGGRGLQVAGGDWGLLNIEQARPAAVGARRSLKWGIGGGVVLDRRWGSYS